MAKVVEQPAKQVKRVSQKKSVGQLYLAAVVAAAVGGWSLFQRWHRAKKEDGDEEEEEDKGSSAVAKCTGKVHAARSPAQKKAGKRSAPAPAAAPSKAQSKPLSQKELRKQKKEQLKARAMQGSAEDQALQVLIAQHAEKAGIVKEPKQPEPPKQYFVDYDGVDKGYQKIVQWQQKGKKEF